MQYNPTTWLVIGILILMIMAVVSNSGTQSTENIQNQMFLINCPMPIYNGVATIPPDGINDFGLNYTISYDSNVTSTGTLFECHLDPLSNPQRGANTSIKEYGYNAFGIPLGWLGYVADYLTQGFQHLQAFLTLITYILTPVNIDVFGYTLADLGGIALMVVIGVYVFAYVGIMWSVIPLVLGVISKVI